MTEEVLVFYASVDGGNRGRVENVRCKLFLPKKSTGLLRFKFYPSADQKSVIENMWEFSVEGDIKDDAGKVWTSMRAGKAHWSSGEHESTQWEPDLSEWVMVGEPRDLMITHFLRSDPSIPTDKAEGSFWLTPSSLLSHARMDEPLENGGFSVRTIYQPTFTLPDGTPLVFKERYHFYTYEGKERVTFSEPVLEFELEGDATDIAKQDDLHSLVEDFLVLISFAARQRCMCVGWDVREELNYKSFYRRDIAIPSVEEGRGWPNELIDLADIEEFMKVAQTGFSRIEHKVSVRRALNHTIPSAGRTLESRFVSLYAALESLLSFFSEKEQLVILPSEQFRELESDLRKWLKQHPLLQQSGDKRSLIYEKIRELNRVSFSAAFKRFCGHYSVDLSDLWPVTGKAEDWPLSEIRNKLVHGATFDYRQDGVLYCAMENLKWSVERMLLAILGWPVSRSRVSPDYLTRVMTMHNNWKTKRELLTG
ncbi:MAG TPA: hypothetical protein VEY11_00320 [Pyrinomonadaceae bacterium]|nr:hypothetical protein [Pyrinomonadaceae bacterium]